MRVIAGMYKGRTIRTVNDLSVRPATDRVRQTLFDTLATRVDWEGARVLDLFAGSGSLGIEALSRGAGHVTFVELSEEAAGFIEQNVRTLGCEAATEIATMESLEFIRRSRECYDVVFADPPYAFEETRQLPGLIFDRHLVRPRGYLLIEHATSVKFAESPMYDVGPVKKFGRTIVTFFRPKNEAETESPTQQTTENS